MKSEKGITLTSLASYIVGVLVVVGILAVITANFEGTIKQINNKGKNSVEIDKVDVYLLKEVKKQGNDVDTISETEVRFTTGNKYIFNQDSKSIYLNNDNNNIKIAENIEKCSFNREVVNGKTVITVTIKAEGIEEKSIEYVLSNQVVASSYENEINYVHANIRPAIDNYGDFVEYGVDLNNDGKTNNDWKVFYVDKQGHTFIIAEDYVRGDENGCAEVYQAISNSEMIESTEERV